MGGLVDALDALGVDVMSVDGHLPVTIDGAGALPGGSVSVDSRQTSQFASALLLTAPLAEGRLTVTPHGLEGSQRYLEVTIGMMEVFGAVVDQVEGGIPGRAAGTPARTSSSSPTHRRRYTRWWLPQSPVAASPSKALDRNPWPDLEIAAVLERMGCDVRQIAQGHHRRGPHRWAAADRHRSFRVTRRLARGGGGGFVRRWPEPAPRPRIAPPQGVGPAGGIGHGDHPARGRRPVEGMFFTSRPAPCIPPACRPTGIIGLAMSFALAGLRIPGVEIADPEVVAKTWPSFWNMLAGIAQSIA